MAMSLSLFGSSDHSARQANSKTEDTSPDGWQQKAHSWTGKETSQRWGGSVRHKSCREE